MPLLDLVHDIRLQIYSELLVLSEPIKFVADYGPPSPPLSRSRRDGLHPAILRVCRLIFDEAIPLLYSSNRFQFPTVSSRAHSAAEHADIAPFLNKIGTQARFISHIRIPFPTFNYPMPKSAKVHDIHVEDLELIKTKTNIKTLELLIPSERCNYALDYSPIALEALTLLDKHLKAVHSLEQVIITFEEYPNCEPCDDLTKEMRNMGWIVTVKRLPKRTWISCDDRVEFDNEEDCRIYDEEELRRQARLEDEREEKWWQDEYYRRRDDPYRKNDSDYD